MDEREAGNHAGMEEEPRVQIVGAHEVYVNDPRQVINLSNFYFLNK